MHILAVGNGIMRLVAMLVKFQKLMVINYILACYCISVVRDFCDSILFTLQVTGGNRGIGYAVVKRLCKEFDGVVLFTGKLVSRVICLMRYSNFSKFYNVVRIIFFVSLHVSGIGCII